MKGIFLVAGMAPSVLAEGMKDEGLALKKGVGESTIKDVSSFLPFPDFIHIKVPLIQ